MIRRVLEAITEDGNDLNEVEDYLIDRGWRIRHEETVHVPNKYVRGGIKHLIRRDWEGPYVGIVVHVFETREIGRELYHAKIEADLNEIGNFYSWEDTPLGRASAGMDPRQRKATSMTFNTFSRFRHGLESRIKRWRPKYTGRKS